MVFINLEIKCITIANSGKGPATQPGPALGKRGKFHSLGWPVSCIIAKFHDP